MLEIEIDEELHLEKLNRSHASDIFNLINSNREYLRQWLTFVDSTQSLKDTENYIVTIENSSVNTNSETVITILYKGKPVGLIGLKKVDWANRIAEIGYWLEEKYQGMGIITRSCRAVIEYAFEQMGVNRIEIKCGVGNKKSIHVPKRLGFAFEGVERDGELVNGKFIDLEVYSMLKREWHANNVFLLDKIHNDESTDYRNLKRKKAAVAAHKNFFQS
jgi:ribosomal-protein-serine acetyltransferase